MEKIKKTNLLFFSAVKSTAAIAFANFIGYLLYFFVLRGANEDDPDGAALRTIVFGICVFAFSVFLLLKTTKAEGKGKSQQSEALIFKNDFRESDYTLEYKAYFKTALKQRLWGYYIGPALFQIPLIVNYIIVSRLPEKVTIYEYPLSLYKWCMSSIFAYEITGGMWLLGFLLYMIAISIFFSVALFFSYKSIFTKPSYM